MLNNNSKSYVIMHGLFDEANFDLLRERKISDVIVLEGRPSLASSQRICAGVLKKGLTPTVITDNMAGFLFYKNMVKEVWIAYREADEKSAVCLVGSLVLAVLAKKHGVEVRAYPTQQKAPHLGSTKDLTHFAGIAVAPKNVKAYVPLWEPVPCKYINLLQPDFAVV